MKNLFNLSGKVAVIPGGSGGIGSGVATALAAHDCHVIIGYNTNKTKAEETAASIRDNGGSATVSQCDLASYESVSAWISALIAQHGRIDVLASCIGWGGGAFSPFVQQKPTDWVAMVEQQFWAQIYLAHNLVPHMTEQSGGRILFLGSDSAKGGQAGAAVNAGALGGTVSFAKSLAREVGRYGINVNVVCAGPTETPQLEALRATGDAGSKMVEAAIKNIPLKRPGCPAELGAAFVYLASDAGAYVTGQALSVSGGLTML